MKLPRSTAVTAAVVGTAAVLATGITYASAAPDTAPNAAPAVAAAPAPAPAAAPMGGNGNESKGNEGNEGRRNEGRGNERRRHEHREEGRIHINERSFSARQGGDCVVVVSGLGAKSFNIRNDSRKTVEVFRGAVCDNGGPIATVGPHSSSTGVKAKRVEGIKVEDGVVASFRVIKRHDFDRDRGGDRDY